MINLEINFFDLIKKLIFICICFYSNSVLSEETNFVEIIEKYWNETKTISGQFHQVLENDKIASGNFYIEKPYKSNFTYDDKLENIITTKFFINIVDSEKFLINKYPIINQPIYKLLSEKIDLKKTFNIMSVNRVNDVIVLTLVSKNKSSNTEARINIGFNISDYSLKNWEIIDEIGQSTYLEFTKIRKNISIDPGLFTFKKVGK
tara:strand:+ start:399 stop:1013 length:615 start_codon:yes stop_codon:yes gene_type:complete